MLDLVATVVMTVAGVAILAVAAQLYSSGTHGPAPTRGDIPIPRDPVSIAGAPQMGNPESGFAMIIHSDFQCPFCAQFAHETLKELIPRYVATGRLLIVFRNNPLSSHPLAAPAAAAALCAGQQGKFWQAHDVFFDAQPRPKALEDSIAGLPKILGLDSAQFSRCLSDKGTALVAADRALSKELSLPSTPAFLLGKIGKDGQVRVTKTLRGAQPLDEFKTALESLIDSSPVR